MGELDIGSLIQRGFQGQDLLENLRYIKEKETKGDEKRIYEQNKNIIF